MENANLSTSFKHHTIIFQPAAINKKEVNQDIEFSIQI